MTFIFDILRSLVACQMLSIVHGDLKANNILVKGGHAYLHDLGISQVEDGTLTVREDAHLRDINASQWHKPQRDSTIGKNNSLVLLNCIKHAFPPLNVRMVDRLVRCCEIFYAHTNSKSPSSFHYGNHQKGLVTIRLS